MDIPICSFEGVFWRFVRPDYVDTPFSGKGAAKTGARFNRKDQRTLYLSCDANTASLEFKGGRPKAQEHYIFRVKYFLHDIVDLTSPVTRNALGTSLEDIHAPWRDVPNPLPHQLTDKIQQQVGVVGVKYPSNVCQGVNLVLWHWDETIIPHLLNAKEVATLRIFQPANDS